MTEPTINPDHAAIFAPHLEDGEDLLWSGTPDPKAIDGSNYSVLTAGIVGALFRWGLLWGVDVVDQLSEVGPLAWGVIALLAAAPLVMVYLAIQGLRSSQYLVYAISSSRLFVHDVRNPKRLKIGQMRHIRKLAPRNPKSATVRFLGLGGEFGPGFDRFVGLSDPAHVEQLVEPLIDPAARRRGKIRAA